jgi:hypothetical protein
MTIDNDTAARRIMNRFGEESRIPYLNIPEGDAGILIGFPLLGLLIGSMTGIESIVLPLVVGGVACGILVVTVSPTHLSGSVWLADLARYLRRPQITLNQTVESDHLDGHDRNRSGLQKYTPFDTGERTQELTNIERAWPGAGAIQRSDETMEAFIEVSPGNMDFALSDDWAQLQNTAADFVNKELNSKLKFHATTRSFPVEQITANLRGRLDDDDVKQNPILRELLEEYRETRPAEMRDQGIHQVRYYLGVEVTPLEVYDRSRDERTPAEKLTQFPIIGFLFNPFVTRRDDFTDVKRRARMFETLDTRVNEVRTEFVQQASGWSARRLTTVELFLLNMDFWNGREHDYDDPEQVVRTRQMSGNSRREDTTDA